MNSWPRALRAILSIFVLSQLSIGCTSKAPSKVATESPQPGQELTQWFIDSFSQRIREAEPAINITRENLHTLRLEFEGDELNFYLDNALQQCSEDPAQREEVLERHLLATLESLLGSVNGTVVPVIKDTAYLTEVRATLASNGQPADTGVYWEPLNEELIVLYALDTETSIHFLAADEIDGVLPREERRATAVNNLLGTLPTIEKHGSDGTYMVTAGGNYEVSLILADSIWNKETFDVKGEFVIAVPARDLLLVTGSEDETGLATLREQAQSFREKSYFLTPTLFIRRGTNWQIFERNRP